MSEQGFRGVPGVPEGWELVGIRKIKEGGDWTINSHGEAWLFEGAETLTLWPVIRKIEQPAKYRPFANAEEFKPHRDRWVTRVDQSDDDFQPGAWKVVAYDDHGCWSAEGRYKTWDFIFDHGQCFDDDGTPFGVKIDE